MTRHFVLQSKAISYAVWYPSLGRSHVTLARGIHFNSMGYSILREGTSPSSVPQEQPGPSKEHHKRPDQQKRLELLPEETIYLVERGSLLCFKSPDEVHTRRGDGGTLSSEIKEVGLEHIPGPPMTVQQVYSEMVGVAGLSLEKLQVRLMIAQVSLHPFLLTLIFVLPTPVGLYVSPSPRIHGHTS